MTSNTKAARIPIKAVLFLAALVCSSVASGDSEAFDETFGRVNNDFPGFSSSREVQDKNGNVIFRFEVPPMGIETDSKQQIQGIFVLIDAQGKIVRVKPITPKVPLPDQKTVNASVEAGEGLSKFLEQYKAEEQVDVQLYGLLNKWSTAVLVRTGGALPKFDPTENQREKMESLFKGAVKIPDSKESEATDKIEAFAKAVIRFSSY